jgi:3-oxoacyl-[acyl-carrier-protein] synthase II
MVLGEGAGVLVLEELEHARARGARIRGEIVAHAARTACGVRGSGDRRRAIAAVMRETLARAGMGGDNVGHVHAQGLSTKAGDRDEAAAIQEALGTAAAAVPVVSAKGHFGNLGAGSGVVECAASIAALDRGELFPLLNYEKPAPDCPIKAARRGDPAGEMFLSTAASPQGQASAVLIRRWRA